MTQTNSVLKPGSKIEKLAQYLKQEIVGTELMFTSEHARHLVTELSVGKPESVWNMLRSLERRRVIVRKRRSGEKGIIVSFRDSTEPVDEDKQSKAPRRGKREEPPNGEKASSSPTIIDALGRVMKEVGDLRTERKKINAKIREKQAFFNQLKSMLPRR